MGDKPADRPHHKVTPGDRMSRIAFIEKYANYLALYNHAWNAELRKKRLDPEILNPDEDIVYLPPKDAVTKGFADKDEAAHVHDTELPALKLHFSCAGMPVAAQSVSLLIQTDPYSKLKPYLSTGKLKTDGDGYLEIRIDARVTEALLFFDDLHFQCHLLIGYLRPLDVTGGPEQRLWNLGYACPVVAPTAAAAKKQHLEKVARALRRFQLDAAATQTGTLEKKTLEKLKDWAHPKKPKDYWAGPGDPKPITLKALPPVPNASPPVRDYYVTTNTDVHVALPWMAVSVRCALYLPPGISRSSRSVEGETWSGGHFVLATFQRSTALVGDGAVTLENVSVDGGTALAAKKVEHAKAGVAFTDVDYSHSTSHGNPVMAGARASKLASGIPLGLAKIPLVGLPPGKHLLKIVPPQAETTMLDGPAGPMTVIPDRGTTLAFPVADGVEKKRTYRPLFVRYELDASLHLAAKPVTCRLDKDKKVAVHTLVGADAAVPPKVTLDGGAQVDAWVSHGYVTAWASDEIALDLKPDVVRSVITARRTRNATDMIVVHHTAGQTLGPAVNTAIGDGFHGMRGAPSQADLAAHPTWYQSETKNGVVKWEKLGDPWGTQYEIDLDGHVVKFCNDTDVCYHAAPSRYCLHPETPANPDVIDVNDRSIGIELVNEKLSAQSNDPYPVYQVRALADLLRRLTGAYPVTFPSGRYRVVTHCCVENAPTMASETRLNDPGHELDWPYLESLNYGHEVRTAPLTDADYAGFFALTADDLKGLKFTLSQDRLVLKRGANDGRRNWGGIAWSSIAWNKVPADLKPKATALTDIVKAVQLDLRALGYSTNADGDFTEETSMALNRFIIRAFSGSRTAQGPAGGNHPPGELTVRVAEYLRASAAAVRPPGGP
jgi:N-acetyl-anhydromuramyl-L-alanine amidase AmpD